MSEPASAEGPIQEFEIELFRALDRYFEVRRRELEQSIERAGTEFKNFQEARRQLMEAEQELEHIHNRTADLKGQAMNTLVESSEATELEEGMSGSEKEFGELAEVEQSALGRKRGSNSSC